jgi:hypothetical protein
MKRLPCVLLVGVLSGSFSKAAFAQPAAGGSAPGSETEAPSRYVAPLVEPIDEALPATLRTAVKTYDEKAVRLDVDHHKRWLDLQKPVLRSLQADAEKARSAGNDKLLSRLEEAQAVVAGRGKELLTLLAADPAFSAAQRSLLEGHYAALQKVDAEYRTAQDLARRPVFAQLRPQFLVAKRKNDAALLAALGKLQKTLRSGGESRLTAAPLDLKRFAPGAVIAEYARTPAQLANRSLFVPEEDLGDPQQVRIETMRPGDWGLSSIRTGFAKFFLRLEESGEYVFTIEGPYTGGAILTIQGPGAAPITIKAGQPLTFVKLERGMVQMEAIGRIGNEHVPMSWKPPSGKEVVRIPAGAVFHDRDVARAFQGN